MRYLRALAVVAVLVPLVAGTGCVTKQVYDRDVQVERDKTVKAMKERDQARIDLKKANDTIADLTQTAADAAKVREQFADERKRADTLQASIKTEVEQAKKAQKSADQAEVTRSSRNSSAQLTRAREEIATLQKEVEKLRKEARTVTPPTAPGPTTPGLRAPSAPPVTPPPPPT